MRVERHVARIGAKRNPCKILVGKPEENRSLGKPRSRRMDNIKIDLKRDKMGWCGLN
jgi:ferredoxin-thioredoxin reductase catalytic subunit